MFIEKGQTKSMIFRLADEATSQTYDVVFKLEHTITGEVTTFSSIDVSDFRDRYSEFVWNETSLDLEEGHYTYTVYQMPVSSPPSTDINLAVKVIDSGKLEVREYNSRTTLGDDDKNTVTFEDE
jgi:hypothetical protein